MNQGKNNQMDHLILPKKTLARFADEKQSIHILNLNDMSNIRVSKKRARSFHTECNYYLPKYDKKVKILETEFGNMFTRIRASIQKGCEPNIDPIELKESIIKFLTIEYHRSVVVDDDLREKYMSQQLMRNEQQEMQLIQNGLLDSLSVEHYKTFRAIYKDREKAQKYTQNILGNPNNAIISTYSDCFCAHAIYIQDSMDYSFLLPPMHFVGNELFAIFVLAPNVALGLYPQHENIPFFWQIPKERVEAINLRVLESVTALGDGFREVVGRKADLDILCDKIKKILSATRPGPDSIIIDKQFKLYNEYDFALLCLVLYIQTREPVDKPTNVTIAKSCIENNNFHSSVDDFIQHFKKYNLNLQIVDES